MQLCKALRRRRAAQPFFYHAYDVPVECAALPGRRVARASQAAKIALSAPAAARQKLSIETLMPADATRDKRSMLITPVALLEGWCRCQSLDIKRQTPCKECWGAARSYAHRTPSWRPVSCLAESGPARMLNAQRRNHERNTTRPAHRDAVPPARPARAAATALARRLPLATPSSAVPLLATSKTAFYASSVAPSMHWSSRRGARPRFGQLRPLLENNCAPCYTFQQPQYTRSSAADQTAG